MSTTSCGPDDDGHRARDGELVADDDRGADDDDVHPLAVVLAAAAEGRFPPVDGGVEVLPPDRAGTGAVVELTGHSYVLTARGAEEVAALGLDGFGRCTHPDVLVRLAGRDLEIGSHDAVLVARGGRRADGIAATARLVERTDLEHHPRVVRARHHRRDVRVLGDDRGLVTIGRGLVGRWEISVELTGHPAGRGAGRELVAAGLAAAPTDGPVWAQVAPGNAASLRAFLAAGFVPVGSEVLLSPRRPVHDRA